MSGVFGLSFGFCALEGSDLHLFLLFLGRGVFLVRYDDETYEFTMMRVGRGFPYLLCHTYTTLPSGQYLYLYCMHIAFPS